jgi:hypothetical protein
LLKARLARFYGWGDREIESMSYGVCQEYALCIEPLMAEEALTQLPIVSFPHIKKSGAQKIERDLRQRSKRNLEKKQTQQTTADIYEALLRKFNG